MTEQIRDQRKKKVSEKDKTEHDFADFQKKHLPPTAGDKEYAQRKRTWVFTKFAYDDEYIQNIRENKRDAHYMVWGYETCPTTDRLHLQGYIRWKTVKSFAQMKKVYPGAYIYPAIAGDMKNREYCTKGRLFEEYGEPSKGQGERTDLENIREEIQKPDFTMRGLILSDQNYGYQALLYAEKAIRYTEQPRSIKDPCKVYWLYGPTGVGKTLYFARKFLGYEPYTDLPRDEVWKANHDLSWFDGYDGHKKVLIDDFRESMVNNNFKFLLDLTGGAEVNVPIKGSFRQWKPDVIVVTSPKHPSEYFPLDTEDKDQLLRRCTGGIYCIYADEEKLDVTNVSLEHFQKNKTKRNQTTKKEIDKQKFIAEEERRIRRMTDIVNIDEDDAPTSFCQAMKQMSERRK